MHASRPPQADLSRSALADREAMSFVERADSDSDNPERFSHIISHKLCAVTTDEATLRVWVRVAGLVSSHITDHSTPC